MAAHGNFWNFRNQKSTIIGSTHIGQFLAEIFGQRYIDPLT